MSDKIKSKDLSYDTNLPPFLQRLRAQNSGRGDRDLHERPLARPQKAKVHDEEDGPTVVDESGELLSKDDLSKRIAADEQQHTSAPDTVDNGDNKTTEPTSEQTRQDVASGVANKKRKAPRIIEERDELDDEAKTSARRIVAPTKKAKKKAKPVKLAFEDDDG